MSNTPSPAVELLPCPFCGSTGDMVALHPHWVSCVICEAEGPYGQKGDQAAAIEGWNTRTPIPTGDEPRGREFMDANDLALWRSINDNCQDGHDRAGVNHNTLRRLLNTVDYWRNAALSTPTSGEASAPPSLSELRPSAECLAKIERQEQANAIGYHAVRNMLLGSPTPAESGAGAREDVKRVVAVEKIECVPFSHPFDDAAVDPIWRIEINGYCADFEHREAAENFAAAINALASSPTEQMREAGHDLAMAAGALVTATDGMADLREPRAAVLRALKNWERTLGGNHDQR